MKSCSFFEPSDDADRLREDRQMEALSVRIIDDHPRHLSVSSTSLQATHRPRELYCIVQRQNAVSHVKVRTAT